MATNAAKKTAAFLILFSLTVPALWYAFHARPEQPVIQEVPIAEPDEPSPILGVVHGPAKLTPEPKPEPFTFASKSVTSTEDPILCSCVKSARSFGAVIPLGTDASDIKANSAPHVGALALFSYPTVDHVAVVVSISDSGFTVDEGNFKHCEKTQRFVAWQDPSIRGFATYG